MQRVCPIQTILVLKKKENPIWEKAKAINNLFNVFKLLFIF